MSVRNLSLFISLLRVALSISVVLETFWACHNVYAVS